MSEGLYVNGIEVVFCDRCESGYEGVSGLPPAGGLTATFETYGDDNVPDAQVVQVLCVDCADEAKQFFDL